MTSDVSARRSFYHGCSTFLPVFDANVDTYDNLHERSPFAVDCICMVAARVRDGGGKVNPFLPLVAMIDARTYRQTERCFPKVSGRGAGHLMCNTVLACVSSGSGSGYE